MGWAAAAKKDMQEILEYLKGEEPFCVSLLSKLTIKERTALPAFGRLFFRRSSAGGTVNGAFLMLRGGALYPMISGTKEEDVGEIRDILKRNRESVVSIIGEERGVDLLSRSIDRIPAHRIDYDLLVHTGRAMRTKPLPEGFCLRTADCEDAEALFPLQAAYEREEVLISEDSFNARVSFLNLKRSLATEVILILEKDGIPVAKAGTNARGIGYAQIGGVYTLPALRNLGYGKATVSALVRNLAALGLKTCLFVKKANTRAQNLYRVVGFTRLGDFRIQYYS